MLGPRDHYDLAIIGSGSGNTIVDEAFADRTVALVERNPVFGGTCLNVGCIPTKMFVLPADLAASPATAARLGVDLRREGVDFGEIRDRIFGRIDPISAGGKQWRQQADNLTLFDGEARFVGPKRLRVGDQEFGADEIVLATGSSPVLPDVPGMDLPGVHTSDTVMRIPDLPGSVVIIGGGFVAAEFAHIFSAFGAKVTQISRSDALLRAEDITISRRFTELTAERVTLRLNQEIVACEEGADGRTAVITRDADGVDYTYQADIVLVATGRAPNSAQLDPAAGGVNVDDAGYVIVDDYQRTTAEGVYALGDVCSPWQLKHVANAEARVVKHNLLHPDDLIKSDHRFIPHAIFTDPQIASVGLTEQDAVGGGVPHVIAIQDYGAVAYGWALEDTDHLVKLIADPDGGQLLGCHIMGPQASTLIQPLVQAMTFGLPAREMARGQYWIHPALTEVVENALLALPLGGDR
ncbi:mycothione reductase [Naumannella cuiyingiana]|uniref:Mycothione reductase n=1 Tax=Naumannella cuiyingiana TaxID=1347891 RepID=A0A7Z0DA29_9ACTN|nr:mycothione reductase [Naumannella cuiyingiana]NYI71520.1 mycothione reductase [Naumannella cuiyingiana]